jgi:N6-adenosine-specific RNA methylase IME4
LSTTAKPVLLFRSPQLLAPHPQAGVVPAMSAGQFEAFRADIAAEGVLVPLDVDAAGVVLDGRQRLRAALELGLDSVPVRLVAVEDELAYILRAALLRRDLSESQRAALQLDLIDYEQARAAGKARSRANLRHSGVEGATLPPRAGKLRDQLAREAGVSPRTAQDALTVRQADPILFERLKAGEIPAHRAAQQVRRAQRYAEIPPAGPLPEGPFELIYADPPWQLGNPDGAYAPENHYPTMPLAEIMALAVPAAASALLFLWAVNCLLPEALQVIAAWGFTYVTNLAWVKESIGLGSWIRNRHELLLVARRGGHPPAEPRDRVDSVIEAPRRRHSQKPDRVYELLERMHPHASKLELFRRGSPRPGWAAWGNEAQT